MFIKKNIRLLCLLRYSVTTHQPIEHMDNSIRNWSEGESYLLGFGHVGNKTAKSLELSSIPRSPSMYPPFITFSLSYFHMSDLYVGVPSLPISKCNGAPD